MTGIGLANNMVSAMLPQPMGSRLVGGSLSAALVITTPGLPAVVLLAAAIGFATNAGFGPITAYLTERFPSRIRASGFGVGCLALVIPAFYSFYLACLGSVVPYYLAPVVLVVIAGLLCPSAALGPETRDADLRR